MATSGRVYTGYIADSRFYVEWAQSKQDVEGNYTVISYTIGLNNGDWWYTNALKINSVVINGSTVLSNKTYSNITAQGDVVLATGTATIYHGDDGSKSFSISISGWGYDEGTVSGSDSWTLTTIPRKTDISLSASSVYFGNNITINCPKKASGFTNKLYYKINSGSWVLINANAGNSHVFNVAMSLIANIPNDMSCTFTIECDTYNGSTFIGSSTKTFTASVPSSARTAPKLNKTAILLRDESVTITLEPHAGTWQHVIAYSMGNASGYIQSTMTTNKSFTFTPSIELAQQIPSATSGNVTITVYTYNGSGTLVGSTTATLKVTVPDDIVPTISGIEVEEAVQLVQDNFDGFVQNLSQLLVSVASSGAQGSTIASCKTTVDGISYLGTEFTSGVITNSGESLPISAVVTDTRGRTSAVFTVNIKVIEYIYPSVSLDVDVVTGKVIINLAGAVSSVKEQNTRQLELMYRAVTEETYTREVIPLDAWSFDMSIERNIDASEVTYELIAVLTDKIETVTAAMLTGKVLMSRRAGGTGVTFGGEAETDGLVSKWNASFSKDIAVDGTAEFDGGAIVNNTLMVSGVDHTITEEEYAELEALIASISVGGG